jgi:WD40 repeat protein
MLWLDNKTLGILPKSKKDAKKTAIYLLHTDGSSAGNIPLKIDNPKDILFLAVSPDGKNMVVASYDTVFFLNGKGNLIKKLEIEEKRRLVHPTFSPDSKRIAFKVMQERDVNSESRLLVTDIEFYKPDGTVLSRIKVPIAVPGTIQPTSRPGTAAKKGEKRKYIRIWNASTGKEAISFPALPKLEYVFSVAFSPDGKRLLWGNALSSARVWDLRKGKLLFNLQGHARGVPTAIFSPNGNQILTADECETLKIWNAKDGKLERTIKGEARSKDIVRAAWSPNGKLIAAPSADKTIKLFDVNTGEKKLTLYGHEKGVVAVAFSPSGKRLASASWDRTVKIWDVKTGKTVLTLTGHKSTVAAVSYSPGGEWIASSGTDFTVRLWNANTGKIKFVLTEHSNDVIALAFSPTGDRIASGDLSGNIMVWDTASGSRKLLITNVLVVTSVAFSPDGKMIVSGSLYD